MPELAKENLGVETEGCRRWGPAEATGGGEGQQEGSRWQGHLTASLL